MPKPTHMLTTPFETICAVCKGRITAGSTAHYTQGVGFQHIECPKSTWVPISEVIDEVLEDHKPEDDLPDVCPDCGDTGWMALGKPCQTCGELNDEP
jgi:hypothetical protein